MIIVIPCYDEPEAMATIRSLFVCERGNFGVQILVVVNSYRISPESAKQQNLHSFQEMQVFASQYNTPDFQLVPMWIEDLPGHQTGAGLPRKIGMDEAARRFQASGNKQGIIISLDADTTVEKNYLKEIVRCFREYHLRSATIEFHHPVEYLKPADPLRRATETYETYLRYYRAALEYTGYPYAYYTIGSAFAVTVETYRQAGGMGKQQAGEDFYFLQKVFPLGKTKFIDTTCVYPAARISHRVPFGTGLVTAKMIEEQQFTKYTYQVKAFTLLKHLFDRIDHFYRATPQQVTEILSDFPEAMLAFLSDQNFVEKIDEINRNTAGLANFKKRFFNYFTAFRILKYLNFVHPEPFGWREVRSEAARLLP
ncbi:MAG: hypothetical protein LBN18_07045 [Dysgonamonadaceae bacterium]|nr:hypothetical protein [Dysgonamonadaceae bacterium]